jgi:hypothetical protein
MANYAVTNTVYSSRSLATLGDSIEAALEAIDEVRLIRLLQVFLDDSGNYTAILITDDA